jgi:hypothetical protein
LKSDQHIISLFQPWGAFDHGSEAPDPPFFGLVNLAAQALDLLLDLGYSRVPFFFANIGINDQY